MATPFIYYASPVHSFVASQDRDAAVKEYTKAVGWEIIETVYEEIARGDQPPMADRSKFRQAVEAAVARGANIIVHSRSNIGSDASGNRFHEAQEYAGASGVSVYTAGDDPSRMMARSM